MSRKHSRNIPEIFSSRFSDTYTTTLRWHGDGSVFVITGDIPAMSRAKKFALLETPMNTHAGTGFMHEGFHKYDP